MIKFYEKNSNKKGSLTVEMALIFPLIFAFTLFIMFAAAVIYNRTTATAIVNKNLDKAAIFWLKSNLNFETGEYIAANTDIYSSLFDFKSEEKKEAVSLVMEKDVKQFMFTQNVDINTDITSKNYVIFRKLKVNVNINYGTPFGGIFKLLGVNEPIVDSFQVDAAINNPVEFTRNVDIALEIYKEFVFRYAPEGKDPLGMFSEKIENIKNTIDNFDNFAKGN